MGADTAVLEYQPVVHRLRLSASPYLPTYPGRISLPQEPLGLRRRGFSPLSRYSYQHSHSTALHDGFHRRFSAGSTLPYHSHPVGPERIATSSAANRFQHRYSGGMEIRSFGF